MSYHQIEDDETGAETLLGIHVPKGRKHDTQGYYALDSLDERGQLQPPDAPKYVPPQIRTQKVRRTLIIVWLVAVFSVVVFVSTYHSLGNVSRSTGRRTKLSNGTTDFYETTILVSLDGFHPHYVSAARTPHLDAIARSGSSVPYMVPSFPSQTFPNHYTLVTGLYPANHGIVGNSFYDPKMRKSFDYHAKESLDPEFWGGEPIWATARRFNRISAVHMWPGSEVHWPKNQMPHYLDPFNQTEALELKARRVFEWLDLGISKRPELILSYVPTVDTTGHAHGIAGKKLEAALKQVDDLIGLLQDGIQERNLTQIVNLVIVSDHGMAPTSNERLVFLDEYIDLEQVARRSGWPSAGLWLKENGHTDTFLYNLTSHLKPNEAMAFKSSAMPLEFHFGSEMKYGYRLPPLYIIPQLGYSLLTHEEYDRMNGTYNLPGVHGYANTEVLMRSLFLATGPQFFPGKYKPFPNVNVYSIVCRSLGITPPKSDGNDTVVPMEGSWTDTYPDTRFDTDILKDKSTLEELYG